MQFSSSPLGHLLLAYNSSRICVLDVRGREVVVTREFKIARRPVATCIKDDGSLLAVLLTEMQVDFYDLTQSPLAGPIPSYWTTARVPSLFPHAVPSSPPPTRAVSRSPP